MAPVGEVYFPPLDRCFSGEYQLLSWQAAYIALSQQDAGGDDATLKRFLADPQAVGLLNIFSPFDKPNLRAKAIFETKTSVISVSASPHACSDITRIKEDALWLSKTASIDEVSALRITVLEWQTRPRARLLENQAVERSGTHGLSTGGASILRNQLWKESELQGEENLFNRRRVRLLEIFLSERCYILKVCEYILSHHLCILHTRSDSSTGGGQNTGQDWVNDIGKSLFSRWSIENSEKGKETQKDFMGTVIPALDARRQDMSKGCTWLEPEATPESLQVAWARNGLSETIHILQFTLRILEAHKMPFLAEPVLEWFSYMKQVHFYEGFGQLLGDVQGGFDLPLQSLVILVSLTLIDVSNAVETLLETPNTMVLAAERTDSMPYFLSPRAVTQLHETFVDFAPLRVASPVILAWSIIVQTIREMASVATESKDFGTWLRPAGHHPDSSNVDSSTDRFSSRPGHGLNNRRSSTESDVSLQPLLIEEIQEATTLVAIEGDSVSYLAVQAIQDENVFDVINTIASEFCTLFGFEHSGQPGRKMRNKLLELVRSFLDFIQYQPALIDTTVCVLTGKERFWDLLDRPTGSTATVAYEDQPSNLFIRDPSLRQKLLLVAVSRFPYESIPFLELCRALAFQYTSSDGSESLPWANLEELDTFTCKLPQGFEATEPIREEEEGNFIRLTDTLSVLIGSHETDLLSRVPPLQKSLPPPLAYANRPDLTVSQVVIPVGATGVVHIETKPFVVGWNHKYPGLAFMGKMLQRASATGSSVDSTGGTFSPLVVAEVIRLINALLVSAMKNPRAGRDSASLADSAQSILGQASDGLDRNQDIISVILQIFDNELHNPQQQESPGETSLEVLIECTHFANALILILPDRVWPFIGRSGLLRIDQEESQLNSVLSVELVIGQYEFLLGCIRLFEALIDDTIHHEISRNAMTKSIARFGAESLGSGVSQSTTQTVLLSFTRSMVDVLESAISWRFVVPTDQMEINFRLCSAFNKIVTYCYGVGDDSHGRTSKITTDFAPAAKYLIDAFLSTSNNDYIVKPLVNILANAVDAHTTTLPKLGDEYQPKQTIAALELASTMLHINTFLSKPTSYLEAELFKATPVLARVYVSQDSYRLPVVSLLNALLSASSAASDRHPQSLLGHLGHDDANHFLEVLSQLDSPISSTPLCTAIWKFFSAVVSKRQQWFAMYLLTGVEPRESLSRKKEGETGAVKGQPTLNIALNSLSSLDKLDPSRALAMLDFVATAADNWPWVFTTIQQHPDFLKSISEFTAQTEFLANATDRRSGRPPPDDVRLQMLAYISQILAMHTYTAQQNNDQKAARSLVPHLNYLIKNAISTPTYNTSLHMNLRSNLETKFPGCRLADFKRAQWRDGAFGESFYYDINFASQVLSYDVAWLGRKGQGFMEEFKRANKNLSLVEAQINLFHGWKYLLVELSRPLAPDVQFQKIMASAVIDCLRTNADDNLPQVILDRLSSSRADLAFTLLQRLVEVQSDDADIEVIFPAAWNALRSYNTDIEIALGQKDAGYYRLLLRILYLTIQLHKLTASTDPSSSALNQIDPIILEILSNVIARGFRSLTALLHSSPDRVLTSDFSMLTAILRSCLQVPYMDQCSAQLLTAFSDSQTAYCAATLLSWSDQLAASTSGDPIYGELSIQFLVELSTNTSLAESLAVDGVLAQVLSTQIIRVLQSRTFTPVEPLSRMYKIWAEGILPLLLNLLNAIGPPIAAEVAAALNNFPKQLSHSANAFANSTGYVTLSMVKEAHDLALITSILGTIREAGASAGISAGEVEEIQWDSAQLKEDVSVWFGDRRNLRTRIVATNEREEVWLRTKPSEKNLGSETILEKRIIANARSLMDMIGGDIDA